MIPARWLKLVDAALWRGESAASVLPSPWAAWRAEMFISALDENGRVSFCQHLRGLVRSDNPPEMVVFPGSEAAVCRSCVGLFRDEELLDRGRPPACEKCDRMRATALHYAETGAVEREVVVILAFPLCESCAAEEGLRDGIHP